MNAVKPRIFPISKTSNPLVILVSAESQHLAFGKSLWKFLACYSFHFEAIQQILISVGVISYHASQWQIVFDQVCIGHTLLFEFILSTQFFVHHIQALGKISLFLRHYEISLESQSCLSRPVPRPLSTSPLFPALSYSLSYLLGFTVGKGELSFPPSLPPSSC